VCGVCVGVWCVVCVCVCVVYVCVCGVCVCVFRVHFVQSIYSFLKLLKNSWQIYDFE